jgi:hypothetical protein
MAQVRICGGAELERHGWTVNPLVQTERARIGKPQPKTSSSQSYPDERQASLVKEEAMI